MAENNVELQLTRLLEVYQRQLDKLQARLPPLVAKRDNFNMLLNLLKSDMALVKDERKNWEQQWQQWLNEGGVLKSGRSFSAHHKQLTELEQLLDKHRTGIETQRAGILQKISQLNQLILQQQQKMEHIKKRQEAYVREQNQTIQRREQGQNEERVLAQWFAGQVPPSVMGV